MPCEVKMLQNDLLEILQHAVDCIQNLKSDLICLSVSQSKCRQKSQASQRCIVAVTELLLLGYVNHDTEKYLCHSESETVDWCSTSLGNSTAAWVMVIGNWWLPSVCVDVIMYILCQWIFIALNIHALLLICHCLAGVYVIVGCVCSLVLLADWLKKVKGWFSNAATCFRCGGIFCYCIARK